MNNLLVPWNENVALVVRLSSESMRRRWFRAKHSGQDDIGGGGHDAGTVGAGPGTCGASGERVGPRGRGRGRARGWHTRVTARLRQGGQTYRQGRQREGEWEGRQAREGAQGSGTGVARRRAGGTRRARGSSGEREHGKKRKKTAEQADTQEGHIEEAGRGRWGEQGANKGAKEHNVSHREATCR